MLLILPCAGGCAWSYNKYKNKYSDSYIYEYSGHWTRYNEPLLDDSEAMIEDLCSNILQGKYDDKVDILGHSMGGLLAWMLAYKLMHKGFRINHIYIAACCEPRIFPNFLFGIQNDTDIKNVLKELRNVPDNVLRSDFFDENLMPTIRADFSVVKSVINQARNTKIEKLPIDITCLYGIDDVIRKSDMMGWAKYTSREFRIIDYSGNHFFLLENNNILDIIALVDSNVE